MNNKDGWTYLGSAAALDSGTAELAACELLAGGTVVVMVEDWGALYRQQLPRMSKSRLTLWVERKKTE